MQGISISSSTSVSINSNHQNYNGWQQQPQQPQHLQQPLAQRAYYQQQPNIHHRHLNLPHLTQNQLYQPHMPQFNSAYQQQHFNRHQNHYQQPHYQTNQNTPYSHNQLSMSPDKTQYPQNNYHHQQQQQQQADIYQRSSQHYEENAVPTAPILPLPCSENRQQQVPLRMSADQTLESCEVTAGWTDSLKSGIQKNMPSVSFRGSRCYYPAGRYDDLMDAYKKAKKNKDQKKLLKAGIIVGKVALAVGSLATTGIGLM